MDKEQILAASRRENNNKDVAELEVVRSASRIATVVGVLLCVIISALDWYINKTINCACWMVDYGMMGVLNTIKYAKLRRRRDLFMSILNIALFAFFCYGYVYNLLV